MSIKKISRFLTGSVLILIAGNASATIIQGEISAGLNYDNRTYKPDFYDSAAIGSGSVSVHKISDARPSGGYLNDNLLKTGPAYASAFADENGSISFFGEGVAGEANEYVAAADARTYFNYTNSSSNVVEYVFNYHIDPVILFAARYRHDSLGFGSAGFNFGLFDVDLYNYDFITLGPPQVQSQVIDYRMGLFAEYEYDPSAANPHVYTEKESYVINTVDVSGRFEPSRLNDVSEDYFGLMFPGYDGVMQGIIKPGETLTLLAEMEGYALTGSEAGMGGAFYFGDMNDPTNYGFTANLTINETVSVPEPPTIFLILLSLLGIFIANKNLFNGQKCN